MTLLDARPLDARPARLTPTLGWIAAVLDDPEVMCDGDGVLVASGAFGGVPAIVFATDPRIAGGALGAAGCAAIVEAYDAALLRGWPILGIWQSGGARLGEGAMSLDGVGQIFRAMTTASGRIPQISVVLGPAAGGAAYGPALTDVVIMGPGGRVFVTGPDVIRSVTGEQVDMTSLGGAEAHGRKSGVVHITAGSDLEALYAGRRLARLLARPGRIDLDLVDERDLSHCLPENTRRVYDVHTLLDGLLDAGIEVELQPRWAPNITTALGRLGGGAVGIVANNPRHMCGCLDSASAEKAARFVRLCDSFGVPLLVLADVPGYLPGVDQEWQGVVRRGAKLLHAFAEAVVPRVTLVTRKAFGGAYIAMNSRSLGATRCYAWAGAEVDVMGPVAAVRILSRRELAALEDPEHKAAREAELAAEHTASTGGLDTALRGGLIDAVLHPSASRRVLAEALAAARQGRGEHSNIPL